MRSKLAFLLLVLALSLVPVLQAQEQPAETNSTTETLKQRIEKIVEQQKDNVDSAIQEITDSRQGFVAQVTRVTQETLTVETGDLSRVLPLNEVALMENGKEIEPETIAIDDWILALGLREEDSFTPKIIEVLANSPLPDPQVVYLGTLKEINRSSINFQARGMEEAILVDFNNATDYQDAQGEEADLADFVEDDQVLLIGYTDEQDTIATTIRALAPFNKGE